MRPIVKEREKTFIPGFVGFSNNLPMCRSTTQYEADGYSQHVSLKARLTGFIDVSLDQLVFGMAVRHGADLTQIGPVSS